MHKVIDALLAALAAARSIGPRIEDKLKSAGSTLVDEGLEKADAIEWAAEEAYYKAVDELEAIKDSAFAKAGLNVKRSSPSQTNTGSSWNEHLQRVIRRVRRTQASVSLSRIGMVLVGRDVSLVDSVRSRVLALLLRRSISS